MAMTMAIEATKTRGKRTKAKKQKKANKNVTMETDITFNPLVIVQRLVQGRLFLTLGFFKKYWLYIIAATVMLLMYISNKYVHMSSIAKVDSLRTELNNARTDCVKASATYNSQIIESQMMERVQKQGIDLRAPEEPPYILNEE